MTSRWYRDMELARIGALSDRYEPVTYGHEPGCACSTCAAHRVRLAASLHPEGCLCSYCSEVRAAVGGGKKTDKRIAATMEARERGKRAAEQEITAQRRREAAGRAEVTRELAYWGACPYRTSGIDVPFLDGAAVRIEARELPVPPADPVAQWWEATRGLVLPDPGQALAAVPDQPPGTCRKCRTGPLYAGNQCWYCDALEDSRLGQSRLDRAPARRGSGLAGAVTVVVMAVLGCILVSMAMAGYSALIIPGVVLLAAGVTGALRR